MRSSGKPQRWLSSSAKAGDPVRRGPFGSIIGVSDYWVADPDYANRLRPKADFGGQEASPGFPVLGRRSLAKAASRAMTAGVQFPKLKAVIARSPCDEAIHRSARK
jgi:hypothetical protein